MYEGGSILLSIYKNVAKSKYFFHLTEFKLFPYVLCKSFKIGEIVENVQANFFEKQWLYRVDIHFFANFPHYF